MKKARTSLPKPSASVEKPNSFGSWPTMMIKASPFMYPTWTSLESRSATNPSFATPRPISIRATIRASMPAERDGLRWAATGQERHDGGEDHGRNGRIGPRTRTRDGPNTA